MSATDSASYPPAGRDVDDLARSARQALGCDLIMVSGIQDGVAFVVAESSPDLLSPEVTTDILTSWRDVRPGCTTERMAAAGFATYRREDVVHGGGLVGHLHILGKQPGQVYDKELVAALAAHCAFIIGYDRLHTSVRRASAIEELALTSDSFDDLMPRLHHALRAILGDVRVGVSVWDEDSGLLQFARGSFGASIELTATHAVDPGNLRSNAARVFRLQRPFISNQTHGDPGLLQSYMDAFAIDTLMAIPLAVAGRPTGVLLASDKPGGFTDRDLKETELVAPGIAVAVELCRMHERLRFRSEVDTVLTTSSLRAVETGLANVELQQLMAELRRLTRSDVATISPVAGRPLVSAEPGMAAFVDAVVADARAARVTYSANRSVHSLHGEVVMFHVPVGLDNPAPRTLSVARNSPERYRHDEMNAVERAAYLVALNLSAENARQHRAVLARLADREHIADNLHDDVGQLLFAAQIQAESVLDGDLTAEVRDGVTRVNALLSSAAGAMREAIFQLSTPSSGTLLERLHEAVANLEQDWPITIELAVDPSAAVPATSADAATTHALVRVARESLINAAKHAGPCRAHVTVDAHDPGRLRLRIADDGGETIAPAERSGHGLRSLQRTVRKCGGELQVAATSVGTTVTAVVPIGEPIGEPAT